MKDLYKYYDFRAYIRLLDRERQIANVHGLKQDFKRIEGAEMRNGRLTIDGKNLHKYLFELYSRQLKELGATSLDDLDDIIVQREKNMFNSPTVW